MSAPPMKDGAEPGLAGGPPVRITQRRLGSLLSCWHAAMRASCWAAVTTFSLLGFENTIVAILWPGECWRVVTVSWAVGGEGEGDGWIWEVSWLRRDLGSGILKGGCD